MNLVMAELKPGNKHNWVWRETLVEGGVMRRPSPSTEWKTIFREWYQSTGGGGKSKLPATVRVGLLQYLHSAYLPTVGSNPSEFSCLKTSCCQG